MTHEIENYIIKDLDDRNYTLQRRGVVSEGERKGEVALATVGHFNSLHAAVRRVATLTANKSEDLSGWVKEFERVCTEFTDKMNAYSEK